MEDYSQLKTLFVTKLKLVTSGMTVLLLAGAHYWANPGVSLGVRMRHGIASTIKFKKSA